ncbi:MAG: DNA cytosine methyltransferase [Pyrinomonadaceae bacterium]
MKFKCIDAFCGAGGLSIGLVKAGIDVIFGFDNDPLSIQTYNLNKKHLPHFAELHDVTKIDPIDILKRLNLNIGDLFLLAGGPPCQGFSIQRIGSDQDQRNSLVLSHARLIKVMKPKFFLMENVPGLLGKRGGSTLELFLQQMDSCGYESHTQLLNAMDFGVPQRRKRIFVVGVRQDCYHSPFKFLLAHKSYSNTHTTVREAIGDLPSPPLDGSEHPEFPHHRADRLSETNLTRIRALKPGQGMEHLPMDLRADCHKIGPKQIGHRNVYGRMAWDNVAPTITARFDSFTRGQFGHPDQDRSISLREGALLQTFPLDFDFVGTKVEIARQVGNAVPPKLAEALGHMILDYHRQTL